MAAAAGLEAHPRMGRPGRVRGTRELIVGKYVLVYRTAEDVVIVSVIHGARRKR
jgi:addiction module RelE/StbE family toxin